MSKNRNEKLEYVKSIRQDRNELKPAEEPRDYQYLTQKYGKYLD